MTRVALSEVAKVIMGNAPPGESYNNEGEGVPLVAGAADLGEKFPKPQKYTTQPSRTSEVGDLILCIRATIGDMNVSDKVYCLGRGVAGIRPKKEKIDSDYLYFAIKSQESYLRSLGTGSTFLQVRRDNIESIEFPLPELSNQKIIASRLKKVAESIELKNNTIVELDNYLRSLFIEMFGDPVTNPKSWPTKRLEELAEICRGRFSPRPRNDPAFYGGKFPFIQTGDIANSNYRLKKWTQTLNEKGTKVSKEFRSGTIVVAIVGATIGATSILEIDAYAPDSVIGISVNNKKVSNVYIEFLLRFFRPIFVAQAPATARANINLETLKPLITQVPPLDLQLQFEDKVKSTLILQSKMRDSQNEINNLFSSLLNETFRKD